MSFFDKVTKAVGDVVDKGKKDVDLFMKTQKINGEIGAIEKKIAGLRDQIKQVKADAGGRAIDMLRAGTLTSPELQTFLDQITGIEQQIGAEETAIVGKKAEAERIKAEHEAEHAVAPPPVPAPAAGQPASEPPAAPPPIPAAPIASAPSTLPPVPEAAPGVGKFCMQCGAQLTGGAFCPQCGAKAQ